MRCGAARAGPALAPSRRRAEVGERRPPPPSRYRCSPGQLGSSPVRPSRERPARYGPSRPRRGPAGCELAEREGPRFRHPAPPPPPGRAVAGVGALVVGASPLSGGSGRRMCQRAGVPPSLPALCASAPARGALARLDVPPELVFARGRWSRGSVRLMLEAAGKQERDVGYGGFNLLQR